MHVFEEVSTITAKGQTTIPKAVRRALGVDYGGKVAFRIDDRGVTLYRADEAHEDPVVAKFLAFLAADMAKRPDAISALTPTLQARMTKLTEGVDVNLDEAIDGSVEL